MAEALPPIEVTCDGGLDQETQAELKQAGTGFLTMQNCYVDRTGAVRKFAGYTDGTTTVVESGDTSIADSRQAAVRGDELVLSSSDFLYSRTPTFDGLAEKGRMSPVQVREEQLFNVGGPCTAWTSATLGGYTVVAGADWDNERILAGVWDETSAGWIIPPESIHDFGTGSDTVYCQVIPVGNTLELVYAKSTGSGSGSTSIRVFHVDTTAANISLDGPYVLTSNADDQAIFAVCVISSNWCMAYRAHGSPDTISLETYAEGGNTAVTTRSVSTENAESIDVHSDGTNTVVVWADDQTPPKLRGAGYNAGDSITANWAAKNLASTGANETVSSCAVCVADSSNAYAMYSKRDTTDNAYSVHVGNWDPDNGNIKSGILEQRSAQLVTRPFTHTINGNIRVFVGCEYEDEHSGTLEQTHYYLAEIDVDNLTDVEFQGIGDVNLWPIAHFGMYRGPSDGYRVSRHIGAIPYSPATGQFKLTLPVAADTLTTTAGGGEGSVPYYAYSKSAHQLVNFWVDFFAQSTARGTQVHDKLMLTGGYPVLYDGEKAVEGHFFQEPPQPTAVQSDGGSPSNGLPNGTYQYRITYGYRMGDRIIRSRPSVPLEVVVDNSGWAANQTTVTLTIKFCHWTMRDQYPHNNQSIFIEVWRTEASGTATSAFYRVSGSDKVNDPNDDDYTYADNDDPVLTQQQELYTNAQLHNDPPPPPLDYTFWRNRLWLLYYNQVWYSKEIASGRWAEFSAAQVIELPAEGTAINSTPEAVIAFTEDGAYRITGWGPNDAGQGSTLTPAERLPVEQGAQLGSATQYTRAGIFYGSPNNGIWRLTPDYQNDFVGAGIQDETDTNGFVRSIAYEDREDLLWFVLAADDDCTTSQRVAFNLSNGGWSTATGDGVKPYAVAETGGTVYYLEASGGYKVQSQSVFSDGGTFVAKVLEFPWIKPRGVLGEFRLWRAFLQSRYIGQAGLVVQYALNFEPTLSENHTLGYADIDAQRISSADALPLRFPKPSRSRMQSVKVKLTETTGASADTRGQDWISLRLEVGGEPGSVLYSTTNT